ncbi:putative tartrate dehydrogenase/decarboxylase [Alternaria alternata]|nr:putative tartrate dehydrogenase/decarboxylase [Alternaria alternata]
MEDAILKCWRCNGHYNVGDAPSHGSCFGPWIIESWCAGKDAGVSFGLVAHVSTTSCRRRQAWFGAMSPMDMLVNLACPGSGPRKGDEIYSGSAIRFLLLPDSDFYRLVLYTLSSSAQTASVTSFVDALPPRSRVAMPRSVMASTLSINLFAACSSPSHASISDAVQKVPTGFATPLPVMSKAEPWIGSNIDGFWRVGSTVVT